MSEQARLPVLRAMSHSDVPRVVAVQEPASVASLVAVFPQDEYPFPRDAVARRWHEEIDAPGIDCYTLTVDGAVVGYAALQGEEMLHFGIALGHWGTGLAQRAHAELIDLLRGRGVDRTWLTVFSGNGRARAFYEKLGWKPTGERTYSTFVPHPELLVYSYDLGAAYFSGTNE